MTDRLTYTATDADTGERLDRVLARAFAADISRARLQSLIREGCLSDATGASLREARHRVKPGETFHLTLPAAVAAAPEAEAIALDVVYEDAELIVINKPAGLVVHPGAGNWTGTLVNALIAHCGASLSGIGGVRRPGIVHRLDKDTSGLMVVAKSDRAHQGLSEQFAAHGRDGRLERAYQAIIWGKPDRPTGRIEAALGRNASNRQKMSVSRSETARSAITHYEVVESYPQPGTPTRVICRLETGRTHQIRVHMGHIGHPLLGDDTYGSHFAASARRLSPAAQEALRQLGRQALHAYLLGFEHPVTGKALHFEIGLPADIEALVAALSQPFTP